MLCRICYKKLFKATSNDSPVPDVSEDFPLELFYFLMENEISKKTTFFLRNSISLKFYFLLEKMKINCFHLGRFEKIRFFLFFGKRGSKDWI